VKGTRFTYKKTLFLLAFAAETGSFACALWYGEIILAGDCLSARGRACYKW
jgi:hypothetical protein